MPRTSPKRIPIQFGGETRQLIYDFNALAELEDLAGSYSEVARLKALRATVWAGLLAETLDSRGRETKRTLSLLQVGEILLSMTPEEIEALSSAVADAMVADNPPDPTQPDAGQV